MTVVLPGFLSRLDRILADAGVGSVPPHLLEEALTHSSYTNETGDAAGDNERLEFLGDAVLGLIAAEVLFDLEPELDPGDMTRLRAELVSGDALAAIAEEWQLGDALRLGRGEELSGGRRRPSNLSRAMEAVIGAAYLGSGYPCAAAVARAAIGRRLPAILRASAARDAKSALQEWAQAHGQVPTYEVVAREGPDHAPQWTVSARVESLACRATAMSRRQAEKDAARMLLARLRRRAQEDLL